MATIDNKSIALLGGGALVGYGASQFIGGGIKNKKGIEKWGAILAGLGLIGYTLYKSGGNNNNRKSLPQMTAGDMNVMDSYNTSFDMASVYSTEFTSGNATPSSDRNHIYPGIL